MCLVGDLGVSYLYVVQNEYVRVPVVMSNIFYFQQYGRLIAASYINHTGYFTLYLDLHVSQVYMSPFQVHYLVVINVEYPQYSHLSFTQYAP